MKFKQLPLDGLYLVEPEPFMDGRGIFARIFCEEEFKGIHPHKPILQVNHSRTVRSGAVRGMHFQYPPHAEIKMVKCIRGSAYDVAVDIRRGSKSFLRWHGEEISVRNMCMMYIPEGFAHGFQTLEPDTELLYLHTALYAPEAEAGLRYDDPRIGIVWPGEVTEVSDRDRNHPLLSEAFQGLTIPMPGADRP